MTDNVTNILLSGLGGQGTIIAGKILGEVFFTAGYDVKSSEVHDMARRGDVTTHFSFGKNVDSSLITQGEVDYFVAFELLEAMRYINWMKPTAKIIINRQAILPPAVTPGEKTYPGNIEKTFKKRFKNNVQLIDGQKIAKDLGNVQATNVVLVGALSDFFPEIKEGLWIKAIRSLPAPELHDINVKAFYEGRTQEIRTQLGRF
ncbi:MAG: indolepyruvate oxidoreductase subunit beta [Syntrophorhabdales bacterium]|jgi:indolepyruvate ferredoxin oxidoreductase beta subunit